MCIYDFCRVWCKRFNFFFFVKQKKKFTRSTKICKLNLCVYVFHFCCSDGGINTKNKKTKMYHLTLSSPLPSSSFQPGQKTRKMSQNDGAFKQKRKTKINKNEIKMCCTPNVSSSLITWLHLHKITGKAPTQLIETNKFCDKMRIFFLFRYHRQLTIVWHRLIKNTVTTATGVLAARTQINRPLHINNTDAMR